jgi:glycosidase
MLNPSTHLTRPTPSWLEKAVMYEIYPQTFCDSNGDGIGDIPGIIQKLDYIRSLGVNGIWLNPCFKSPFGDAGYDVSDYYQVAPRYGTNEDLCRLFKEAEKRGIHVILDLVAGHTSIEHPWFKESSKHQNSLSPSPYRDWYIWTNSVWEGFWGGQFIRGLSERSGGYMPNFFYF